MNILIVTQNIALGGAQRVAVQLSDYLNKNGHRAWIFTPHIDLAGVSGVARQQNYIECPYPILKKVGHEYKMRGNIFSLALNILRLRRYLKKTIKQYQIDLISAHNPPANWIASFLDVPVVWSCNEPVSLCFSKRKPDYFPLSVEPPTIASRFLQALYEVVDYSLCHWGIDRIVVLSRYTQKGVRNIYNRTADICRVGAEFSQIQGGDGHSIRRRFQCEQAFLLLQVGHFKPEKNQAVSVKALCLLKDRIPDIRLMFVGEGATRNDVMQLAEEVGVRDRIIFAGRIGDDQLRDYYDACDLVIFPSVRQSWGLIVFEALAAGKLSVASSDCGASEVLLDKQIGFVSEPTPEALATKVLDIWNGKSSGLFDGMVERGQNYMSEELTYEVYGRRMTRLFAKILAERSANRS
ncbi:MAG: glycosyltransferase family 1 protein [Candidatus Abyssobacteria bacterium SURF_17]|uniref:Glycosyltransferase family 1 protein n=1 Tax=Candidatus Abyssobacteria bacterium SURF_17 TaxID=2093361 RepID=A0A419F2Z7_9BACT|nr:MAG: glycosyltransferase family 1 protein [Candidatus Abyssubacteria bacterium SURF_17]